MKTFAAAIAATALLAGCASSAETDQAAAWAKCENMIDRASRSSCITKALSDANAERRAERAAEDKNFKSGSAAIEDKAAIERAMGAPDDKTGTTIVREPLD